MASMEERNKTLVLEAFNALFNKRDYEAPLQFVSAAGMSPFGTFETCRHTATMSVYGGRAEVVGIQLDRRSRWMDHAARGELGRRPPLGRPQTAVTQCVRKQNACGNLMMIIGHSRAGKWR